MVLALENRVADPAVEGDALRDARDAAREVASALVQRKRAVFTVQTGSLRSITEFASPLRLLMLMSGRLDGSTSATVSPHFVDETYPALLDLVGRLDSAGGRDLWHPDGSRTLAVGKAKHLFVSVDMPVSEPTPRPDRLLEVVRADQIPFDWYRSRVLPRLSADSLVRVFFGIGGVEGSVFEAADAEAMAEEAMTGEQRRYQLD